ncbi:MAG TPA: hypothetical protein VMZ71_09755, partial [Gemmataceae bacterium]|nr:hypothetical protein [Gemmataceae bacterium]
PTDRPGVESGFKTHSQTIAANTTVEVSGDTSVVTALNSLTQNNGQLRVINGATISPSGTVNTAGALEVGGTLNSFVVVQNGGSLSGNGTVGGNVTAQSGGTIAPGPGPYIAPGTGVLRTATTLLNGGSTYTWELNSWTASPGAGGNYDQLRGTSGAKLNLAGATSGNKITLRVTSLTAGNTLGLTPLFDNTVSRSWTIADYADGNGSGGIQNFSADKFALDTSGFANEIDSTNFSLSLDANSNRIILTYTPVPEPAAVLLVAAGGAYSGGLARRLWLRRKGTAGKPAAI